MMKKEMLFMMFVVGCVASRALGMEQGQQPKVFDKGCLTQINGICPFTVSYKCPDQSPEFEEIVFMKLTKDGRYIYQFQLKDAIKIFNHSSLLEAKEQDLVLNKWDKFLRSAEDNNVIICPNRLYSREFDKYVPVLISGTQDDCECNRFEKHIRGIEKIKK
jgi:hypothetical protein